MLLRDDKRPSGIPAARLMLAAKLCVFLVAFAAAISACRPPLSESSSISDPKSTYPATRGLSGSLWTNHVDRAISPNGEYLLAEQYYNDEVKMLVIPLLSDAEVAVLWDVGDVAVGEDRDRDLISLTPIGWLSDDRCIFAVCGPVIGGARDGDRGIFVLEATLTKRDGSGRSASSAEDGPIIEAQVKELAFVDLPKKRTQISSAALHENGREVVIHAYDTLCSVNLSDNTVKIVKSGPEILETDGLTIPAPSPALNLWVYRSSDGLRMVNTSTGEETMVFPTGASFSFEPVWSPDGRFVAAYTAPKRTEKTAGLTEGDSRDQETSWKDYEVYESEPGFHPMGASITVADRQGRIVKEISAEGKTLTQFRWAPDSSHLLFQTCTYRTQLGMSPHDHSKQSLVPILAYDGVWTASVKSDEKSQILDMAALKSLQVSDESSSGSSAAEDPIFYPYPLWAIGSDNGLLLQLWTDQGGSIWYVSEGAPPVKVADGGQRGHYALYEDIEKASPCLISNTESGKTELWILVPGKFRRATEFGSNFVDLIAYNEDFIVLFDGNVFEPEGVLTVFRYPDL